MSALEKEIKAHLIEYLKNRLEVEEIEKISNNEDFDLVGSGVISSLEFIGLISSIEERFNIVIDFEEHDSSSYTTFSGLANLAAISRRGEDRMDDLRILEVNKDDAYMDQIEILFAELYDYMANTGLLMPLIPHGEKLWRKSIEKLIGGRFGTLLAAVTGETVVGFAHGAIKFSPDYMGGLKVGYITQIFVSPEYRAKMIGKKLVEALEEWFKSKGVHSYELQVLCGNNNGMRFWESLGYKKELLQMRKMLDD